MFVVLFSYKVPRWYTPYRLMYGLHPLMPTKYIVPIVGGNDRDNTSMRVLTSRFTELEKLQEDRMQATKTTRIQ